MTIQRINPGSAPIVWSTIDEAFTVINDNFTSLVATIGDYGIVPIDFTSLSTNVSPSRDGAYSLGSPEKRWRDLHLLGTSIYIGDAIINSTGTVVNLPAGSTIGGNILDEEYFREIAVAGQSNVIADAGGRDVLTLVASSGIGITTDSVADSITFTNSGVISTSAGTGISVSSGTGNVTISNAGVVSAIAGTGISVSSGTGNVTISNTGVVSVTTDPGSGISLDTSVPGVVRITNSAPASSLQAFKTIAVSGQDSVVADSSADTLTLIAGTGISLTTNATADSITITNSSSSSSQLTNGSYLVALRANGSIDIDNGFTINRSTELGIVAAVSMDTVVYTAVNNCSTIKATAQFIGLEDGGDGSNHVQSCDIIVIKRTGPTGTVSVDASIYGTIHSSASPLATFDARWNSVSSKIEITAQPVSLTNTGRVKVFATEINPGA